MNAKTNLAMNSPSYTLGEAISVTKLHVESNTKNWYYFHDKWQFRAVL